MHSAVMYLLLVGVLQGSDSRNRVDLDLVIGADLGCLQLIVCGHWLRRSRANALPAVLRGPKVLEAQTAAAGAIRHENLI